jgi:hypothetical protein
MATRAQAIPYFARKFDTGCQTCHSVVPKLNQTGMDFRARGYRLPGFAQKRTVPIAAWLSARYENRTDAEVDKIFVDKLELISGGEIGSRASYFAEWRTVSLGLQNDGGLGDRSGRFEDLFFNVDLGPDTSLTAGQFRHFQQFDASLRLSDSTPVALDGSVTGEPQPGDSSRQASLRGFSPAGRSPSIMLTHRIPSDRPGANFSDGWYVHGSLPFPGELSIPLTDEARDSASFELDGRIKGVVTEAYLRRGLSSVGGHAFLGRDSQLYTGLASLDPGRWNSTLAIGTGIIDGNADRRLSWWSEYQPMWGVNLGFRIDDTSSSATGYHLYGDFQLPIGKSLLWFLIEQTIRDNDNRTVLQLNGLF